MTASVRNSFPIVQKIEAACTGESVEQLPQLRAELDVAVVDPVHQAERAPGEPVALPDGRGARLRRATTALSATWPAPVLCSAAFAADSGEFVPCWQQVPCTQRKLAVVIGRPPWGSWYVRLRKLGRIHQPGSVPRMPAPRGWPPETLNPGGRLPDDRHGGRVVSPPTVPLFKSAHEHARDDPVESTASSRSWTASVVEHDVQERPVNLQLAVVLDQAELPELVHGHD